MFIRKLKTPFEMLFYKFNTLVNKFKRFFFESHLQRAEVGRSDPVYNLYKHLKYLNILFLQSACKQNFMFF